MEASPTKQALSPTPEEPPASSVLPSSPSVSDAAGQTIAPASGGSVEKRGLLHWLGSTLALIVILLPALAAVLLVKTYVVNSPHYDDFTFAQDWLDYLNHNLTWAKIFSVHLEHRVSVPRMMAVLAHLMGGSDLRWQNGMTLLLLVASLFNLLSLWKVTTGTTVRCAWFPLLIISSLLFCAVQWQMLLWPILFEIIVPIFCITLMLRLWASKLDPWIVLPVSLLLAGMCMLSFANGPIVLAVIVLCIWGQRPHLALSDRWMLTLGWVIGTALALTLYFSHFHNSAPAQFAYGYGKSMTAEDTISSFFKDPKMTMVEKVVKAVSFTCGVLGNHLSRGLHVNNLSLSQGVGLVSVILFGIAVLWVLVRRKDGALLRATTPWIVLGLFSGGTAFFIMLGRVGLSRSGSLAVTARYITHAVPLTIALVALAWILGHRLRPRWRSVGFATGGALLLLTGVEWLYGAQRMELWQNARLQGKALLMFARVFKPYEYLGQTSGDGAYGARLMVGLDDKGQSPFPLLKSRLLSQFHISSLKLRHRQAGFESLNLGKDGNLEAHGYAELPSQRPADLILFTTKNSEGEDEIFGLEFLERYPSYLNQATQRDDEWLSIAGVETEYYARWQGTLFLYEHQLPPTGQTIRAWALDVEKMYVYAIADHRTTPDPQPPLKPRPVDP